MKQETDLTPPDARLLLAPGCAHCPVVLDGLAQLIKAGKLGRLEIINVNAHPQAAHDAGTRSVPWYRIGSFEFIGTLTQSELERWAEHAAHGTGTNDYYQHLLASRQADRVATLVQRHPETLPDLIRLLASLETPMAVRIGVGAVLEELAEQGDLAAAAGPLGELTHSPIPQVRADACHYLGLTGNATASDTIRPLLQDPDAEVREIAAESLATLATSGNPHPQQNEE